MKRSRFSEEQIIAVLHGQEVGVSTLEVCRKHGIGSTANAHPVLISHRTTEGQTDKFQKESTDFPARKVIDINLNC